MIASGRIQERLPEQCPACGAVFAPSLGARRKKVQCPKCREIVSLQAPPPIVVAPKKVEPEWAELQARLVQLEALPARLELLEQQLEWLMDHRPAAEASLLRPGQRLRWFRGAPAALDGADDPLAGLRGETLLHNLRALRSGAITIVAAAGDPAARTLAERLLEIFRQAAWIVQGVNETAVPSQQRGLVLLSGACPPPPVLTTASMALTAAGLPLCCRVDDRIGANEAVLTVVR